MPEATLTPLTLRPERPPVIEIDPDNETNVVTFAANGKYLVSGDKEAVRVWRVGDCQPGAKMEANGVRCLAVSV